MAEEAFRRDNHYVSRGYLKRWATPEKRIWVYRTLVSHQNVHVWRKCSTRGVAYHSHLYSQVVSGSETDEIERWLEQEFESPAAEVLDKATSDARLTPDDWRVLVRFLAAQDVRTPTRLAQHLGQWSPKLGEFLQKTMRESVAKLEAARESGEELKSSPSTLDASFPLRVKKRLKPGEEFGEIEARIVAGRRFWLSSMRHLLNNTAKELQKHRWTILAPPTGVKWFTSDTPVIRLNYHSRNEYDFGGGWGSPGTDILFPIGPSHLLYTQIGHKPPKRGEPLPWGQAMLTRRFIAEHADRMIFAAEPDDEVPTYRQRIVDPDQVRQENEQWARFHAEHSAAERELDSWGDS